jgi:hypothetical protein
VPVEKEGARSSVENPFECLKIHGDASRESYIMQFSCPFLFILSTSMDSEYVTLLTVSLTYHVTTLFVVTKNIFPV